jgi:hypothetical protein
MLKLLFADESAVALKIISRKILGDVKMKSPPTLKLRRAKAEKEGFEPPVQLPEQRFSRPPH